MFQMQDTMPNQVIYLFGTVDSFLIYKLSKEKNHLTDITNASRTMLFNIHTMSWDLDLLNLVTYPLNLYDA